MRIYNPSLGRFLSVDPLVESFPGLSPYQYAANNPIRFIDIDGMEPGDNSSEKFYKTSPKINMNEAPSGSSTNAAGFKRNGPWFWRKMLALHPEMFNAENMAQIRMGKSPIVNETWIKSNPTHAPFKGGKLIHHHVNQGNFAVGIPEQVHYDYFSELHPNTSSKSVKSMFKNNLQGKLGNLLSGAGLLIDLFSNNPHSLLNLTFGKGENVNQLYFDSENNAYFKILERKDIFDKNGNFVERVEVIQFYESFIKDSNGIYQGINKIGEPKYGTQKAGTNETILQEGS